MSEWPVILQRQAFIDDRVMLRDPARSGMVLVVRRTLRQIEAELDFEMTRPAWERFRAAQQGMKL